MSSRCQGAFVSAVFSVLDDHAAITDSRASLL
jgi:hypothetical protein